MFAKEAMIRIRRNIFSGGYNMYVKKFEKRN